MKQSFIIRDGTSTQYMRDVFHPELDYSFSTFSRDAARRFDTLHSAYDALVSWSVVTKNPISPGTEILTVRRMDSVELVHRYGSTAAHYGQL